MAATKRISCALFRVAIATGKRRCIFWPEARFNEPFYSFLNRELFGGLLQVSRAVTAAVVETTVVSDTDIWKLMYSAGVLPSPPPTSLSTPVFLLIHGDFELQFGGLYSVVGVSRQVSLLSNVLGIRRPDEIVRRGPISLLLCHEIFGICGLWCCCHLFLEMIVRHLAAWS